MASGVLKAATMVSKLRRMKLEAEQQSEAKVTLQEIDASIESIMREVVMADSLARESK